MKGGKVLRKYKHNVSMGDKLAWVGVESRDQFKPINKEAEALNKADYALLKRWLIDRNAEVPDNATLGELGKSFNRHDPRLAHVYKRANSHRKKSRVFEVSESPVPTPVNENANDEQAEKEELKKWLDENGVKYHPKSGLLKLKEAKAAREKELAEQAA